MLLPIFLATTIPKHNFSQFYVRYVVAHLPLATLTLLFATTIASKNISQIYVGRVAAHLLSYHNSEA